MAVGYLNERTQKVIDMMLKRSTALSIKEIAVQLEVSTRTIYNELEKANAWLETEEYRLVGKYFPEFSDMEKIYLILHFLGGRLASYSRACLKNHSRSLHTPVLAKFFSDSVGVARYASFI